jgi:hypothetical protein
MRAFLLTIFWISNIGNVSHLLIMASAGWLIISGAYSFSDLSMGVFVTQVAPWLFWVKTVLTALFGEFGIWILSLPVFVISPIRFVLGVIIGWWAYITAKNISVEPNYN